MLFQKMLRTPSGEKLISVSFLNCDFDRGKRTKINWHEIETKSVLDLKALSRRLMKARCELFLALARRLN